MPNLKLLPKVLLCLSIFVTGAVPVMAQEAETPMQTEAPVIQDVQGLRLQLAQHIQDPLTKQVRLDVVVYSQITSDRVQVIWNVNGVSKLLEPAGGVATLSVQPNQYYVVTAIISPQGLGNTQVVARVQAFQADGAYIATASKNIGSLASRDVFPVTPAYLIGQVVLFVRNVATGMLVLILVAIIGHMAFMRFRRWLDRDN